MTANAQKRTSGFHPQSSIAVVGATSQTDRVMANNPSEKQIGARIRIVAEHLGEASTLFADSGFQPIYVEYRSDGHASFWFGKMPDVELNRLVRAIPDHFYALRAKVRKVS